ncbi:MAG: zinc-ribbon domain-containing protein [Deltaproteobacteria bacterium]|nr:zinc-ribbon domain-containing protein [Deltaproteobacteria bacterium]
MLITCNECDTRFNIDESLLEQTGSKVRCSKCKNVFLAYPSSFSEKPYKSSEAETELEAVLAEEIESGVQYKAEEKSEGIEFAMDEAFEENAKVEKKPEEASFDLDMESKIDETQAETEADLEIEIDVVTEDKETGTKIEENKTEEIDKDIIHKEDAAEKTYPSSFSEKPYKSSEVETELDEAVLAEEIESGVQYKAEEKSEGIEFAADEAFEENAKVEKKPEEAGLELDLDLEFEIDETQAETEAELEIEIAVVTEEIDKDIIHKENAAEKTEDEEEASKAFNMGTISDEQEAEKSTAITDKIEEGIIADKSLSKVAANKRISMPVLLLLLATLLTGGAYGTYVLLDSIGINIPFVSDLLKPEVQDAGNLEIYTSDINNKFVENSKIGKLLVITGKAQNGYSGARSYISITGKLYTKGKILSKTKTVYCGTILSELDLLNMDLDVINNRLSNRLGDNKSNIKVKEGSIIPFMIVFADLPENLDEFTIEIAESFPS